MDVFSNLLSHVHNGGAGNLIQSLCITGIVHHVLGVSISLPGINPDLLRVRKPEPLCIKVLICPTLKLADVIILFSLGALLAKGSRDVRVLHLGRRRDSIDNVKFDWTHDGGAHGVAFKGYVSYDTEKTETSTCGLEKRGI